MAARAIATESLLGPVTLGLWTLHLPDRELFYAETFAHGKTALETDPKSAAAQETSALWAEVKKKMESKNS